MQLRVLQISSSTCCGHPLQLQVPSSGTSSDPLYTAGFKPRVWRRVRVLANLPLAALHDKVIAPAFGYHRNYHAYLFTLDI